jgi:hypothetical protein
MIDAYVHLDMSCAQPLVDLERRMQSAAVDRALVVETWSGDNHACLRQLMESQSTAFRVALCFRPGEHDCSVDLLASEMVRALRVRTADLQHLGPLAAGLQSSGKWLLPHAESGIGALAEGLLRLAKLYPELPIYLPHMGWPRRDRQDDTDWVESVSRLRSLPRLVVGISAIAHFSAEPFPHNDVGPFATHLVAALGPERLVAASDYPLFDKDRYAQYLRLARDWIPFRGHFELSLESSIFGEHCAG